MGAACTYIEDLKIGVLFWDNEHQMLSVDTKKNKKYDVPQTKSASKYDKQRPLPYFVFVEAR